MKLKLITENKKPFLVLKYENDEWGRLASTYEKVGLQLAEAQKIYGKNIKGKIYKLSNNELASYLQDIDDVINDVNENIVSATGRVNLGVLRIVPNEENEVKIPLPKYLNIVEFNDMVHFIGRALERLLSTITVAEVNIIQSYEE